MKYKSFKIIVLAVFVLLTAVLIKPSSSHAICFDPNGPPPNYNCTSNPPVTLSLSSLSIVQGSSSTLSWANSTFVSTCTAGGDDPAWSGSKLRNSSQSVGSGLNPGTYSYTIACTVGGTNPGTGYDSITLTVTPSPLPVCQTTHYGCNTGTNPSGTTTGGTNIDGATAYTWKCSSPGYNSSAPVSSCGGWGGVTWHPSDQPPNVNGYSTCNYGTYFCYNGSSCSVGTGLAVYSTDVNGGQTLCGNRNTCIPPSPVITNCSEVKPGFTVSAILDPVSASYGSIVNTPSDSNPKTGIAPNTTTSFTLQPTTPGYSVDPSYDVVTNDPTNKCFRDISPWSGVGNTTYKTGSIGANNCVYNFRFKNTTPIVDCVGAWGTCTAGTQTYSITTPASGGGAPCSFASGATQSCSAPLPMSGTLTATNCLISSGLSSCNSSLTWTTTNPQGISNVTSNTPVANTVVGNGNNGSAVPATVPYGSRTFFLNNNTVPLANATATATCATGTAWDIPSGTCKNIAGAMTGTLTPSPSSCTISTVGASTCNVNLSWTTTNPTTVGGSAVSSAGGGTEGYGDNGGPQAFNVPRGSRTFYLYNTMVELASSTATAECASPLVWDPALGSCQNNSTAMTGTLTTLTPSCTIGSGLSSCNIKLNWSIAHPVGIPTSITAIGMTNVDVTNTLDTPQSGSKVPVSVSFGAKTFHLFNNGVELASIVGNGVCASFTGWDGTKCSAAAYCVPPAVWNGVSCAAPLCSPLQGNACTASNSCGSLTGPGLVACDGTCVATPAISEAGCTPPPGGTAGACALTHYNCTVGTVNIPSKKSNTSNYTWTCDGVSGGASSPTCTELKKKPIFIEN